MPVRNALRSISLPLVALVVAWLAGPALGQINPRVKIVDSQTSYAGPDALTDAFADEDENAPPQPSPVVDRIPTSASEPWTLATLHQQSAEQDNPWSETPRASACTSGCCNHAHSTGPMPSHGPLPGLSSGPPYRAFGLAAGVEATYLKLRQDESLFFGPNGDASYEAAPRVWLQWQGPSGWGLRGRYWQFGAAEDSSLVETLSMPMGAGTFTEDVEMYAADYEITRMFNLRNCEIVASLGGRTGRLRNENVQHYSIMDIQGSPSDDATYILQRTEQEMNGTGITMGLSFRRPLLDSRLALICNLRGSVLWGGNDLTYKLDFVEAVPIVGGGLEIADQQRIKAFGTNGAGMWIGELQAGGEWSVPLSTDFGGGNAFVRILFEGQWWNLPGVSSTVQGPGPPEAAPSTGKELFELVGLTAAVGFSR